MSLKNLAFLSFLQSILITISLVTINICLYQSFLLYKLFNDERFLCGRKLFFPPKAFLYLQFQENALLLYLVPLIWFILSVIAQKIKLMRFGSLILFWSAILNMTLFIFITVDSAYLPQNVVYHYEKTVFSVPLKCPSWNCMLWDYLEKQYISTK